MSYVYTKIIRELQRKTKLGLEKPTGEEEVNTDKKIDKHTRLKQEQKRQEQSCTLE